MGTQGERSVFSHSVDCCHLHLEVWKNRGRERGRELANEKADNVEGDLTGWVLMIFGQFGGESPNFSDGSPKLVQKSGPLIDEMGMSCPQEVARLFPMCVADIAVRRCTAHAEKHTQFFMLRIYMALHANSTEKQ